MSNFPTIKRKDIIRTLLSVGFTKKKEARHGQFWEGDFEDKKDLVVRVPNDHGEDYGPNYGGIKQIRKALGISKAKFYDMVRRHK